MTRTKTSFAGMPRPLTDTERAVVTRVLELGEVQDLEALREQLAAASATGMCSCGCPSIDIGVDHGQATAARTSGRVVVTADHDGGSIMVWIDDGWLSLLEIDWWTDETPAHLPPIEQLVPSGGAARGAGAARR